ncbi:MAG TPA: N-formylglutamate amidohydrolase [Stellaceae bacterium]|jgi:N-formylglutamate amidohydrolase|nr:N-formylglutamate amidohydrolase [Stellaceae bacterium]
MERSGSRRIAGDRVVDLRQPPERTLPLVIASPHSGSEYPDDFRTASRLDPMALRRSEDSFVDEIFAAVPDLGAPLIAARFPRAYLDVNREPWELDPGMFSDALPSFVNARSARVRMGLGTIARLVASGEEIYARKLRFAEAKQRVDTLYNPYHQALRRLLDETEAIFGGYLLLDCHSMPSVASSSVGQDGADIVLGDCHGTSCAPHLIEAARTLLAGRNFAVALNAPYAGGFTTGHYGNPRRHRHAFQIEINRALYMDERRYCRTDGFERVTAEMTALVVHLGQLMLRNLPGAARAAAE